MNEHRRLAYLDALGVDVLVSRYDLPGAAPTRRLRLVETGPSASASESAGHSALIAPSEATDSAQSSPLDTIAVQLAAASANREKKVDSQDLEPVQSAQARRNDVPRFSLNLIHSGAWLWLEAVGDIPFRVEQRQLIEAMSNALRVAQLSENASVRQVGRVRMSQFDWPMHNNPQLDSGAEAARMSLAGFLQRNMQQSECQGIVVLGEEASRWLPAQSLDLPIVTTHSTVAMLSDATLKREVWRDLQRFAGTV